MTKIIGWICESCRHRVAVEPADLVCPACGKLSSWKAVLRRTPRK